MLIALHFEIVTLQVVGMFLPYVHSQCFYLMSKESDIKNKEMAKSFLTEAELSRGLVKSFFSFVVFFLVL